MITETQIIMGMPITVSLREADKTLQSADHENIQSPENFFIQKVFAYFHEVDQKFSTYKAESELSRINRNEISIPDASPEMKEILDLAHKTHQETNGYFNIQNPKGLLDPSGLVKGWAIKNAADILKRASIKNFFIDAGGDIQTASNTETGWTVGIRNPFNRDQNVKILYLHNEGVATSGTYIRGSHIYNPFNTSDSLDQVVSLTVIGSDIYDADRFATAAFAMGVEGINFIESLEGFEGFQIDQKGFAIMTTGFEKYCKQF